MPHLLGVYKAQYRKRFGREPPMDRHHAGLLKKLVLKYGLEIVEHRLRRFVWMPADDFLRKAGYTIAIFYTRWSAFDAQDAPRRAPGAAGCQHTPPCQTDADHSLRNVKDLQADATTTRSMNPPSAPFRTTSKRSDPF